jgi:hypothetical protein
MRASYQGSSFIGEDIFDAEDRLRQLVRLRGQRGRVISAADEERLLEEAVTRLGVSLERARGVLHAEMQRGQISLESDLEDTVAELLKSFAGPRKKLSRRDFEMIANLHATQRKTPIESARAMVKRLMEEEDISPRAAGILRTKRWYRRIKT